MPSSMIRESHTEAVVVQAQALDSACLAMLAEVMGRTGQLDTMEYLMAGMWILLRTPANRALLSTAFDPKKVAGTRYSTAGCFWAQRLLLWHLVL